MPNSLGTPTKSIFLNLLQDTLNLEFEAIGDIGVLTFSADLVAADVVTATINGQSISVTYGTSHAATMTAIAAAITALSGAYNAKVHGATSRVISFLLADDTAAVSITNALVTNGGAGTAVVTSSVVSSRIYPGTPVILAGVGEKVAPAHLYEHLGISNAVVNCIGISIHEPVSGGLLTVATKSYAVIFGQASSSVAVGPVDLSGHDTDTGYDKFVTGTSTGTVGFALDSGSDGDVIRVLLLK